MHFDIRARAGIADTPSQPAPEAQGRQPARRGVKPRAIIEFPEPQFDDWIEPSTLWESLALHMRRHGDTCWHLARAIAEPSERFDPSTLRSWTSGKRCPRSLASWQMIARIEHRYRLPAGHFKSLTSNPARSATGHKLLGVGAAERRRLAWHLPDDFDRRSVTERTAILEWVRTNILTGGTDYHRFQASAIKDRYGIRFPTITGRKKGVSKPRPLAVEESDGHDPDLEWSCIDATPELAHEMKQLIDFKTATLTAIGLRRNGVWGAETSAQKIEHLGLMFGALAAPPSGSVAGLGVPLEHLGFGLLVFPAVWDWYVRWREHRRGFYTRWEVGMLELGLALTRRESGWLRQMPHVAERLCPIPSLVSQDDIRMAQADWSGTCDLLHRHGLARAKEIERVARVHRDPFEPILPILEADSPLGEYRKITAEIVKRMPDPRRHPRSAAEAVRSLLLLRLGLHLGLRQKNMRQLMLCAPGQTPRTERQLETLRRGEIKWSERAGGWEVLIPAIAFKNAGSSFFAGKPFRLVLPDLDGLYRHLDAYVRVHRHALLGGAADPGTFFVKTTKATSKDAAYNQTTFYEAWRLVIQRYGIWNPYTDRGAIEGLLPHGPHNVRDVLATHILKQTGSYEQASYAIQDTPEIVAKHYGRFLPQDKAALAADILNRVWRIAS